MSLGEAQMQRQAGLQVRVKQKNTLLRNKVKHKNSDLKVATKKHKESPCEQRVRARHRNRATTRLI